MASPFLLLLLVAAAAMLIPACMADSVLYTNEPLYAGQAITYNDYVFIMQGDCNLVLYDHNRAIWATGTNGRGRNCYLVLKNDGNLIIYNGNGYVIWNANTGGGPRSNYVLVVQRDRNVVIYGPARASTGTNIATSAGLAGPIIGTKTNTTAAAKTTTGKGV